MGKAFPTLTRPVSSGARRRSRSFPQCCFQGHVFQAVPGCWSPLLEAIAQSEECGPWASSLGIPWELVTQQSLRPQTFPVKIDILMRAQLALGMGESRKCWPVASHQTLMA